MKHGGGRGSADGPRHSSSNPHLQALLSRKRGDTHSSDVEASGARRRQQSEWRPDADEEAADVQEDEPDAANTFMVSRPSCDPQSHTLLDPGSCSGPC